MFQTTNQWCIHRTQEKSLKVMVFHSQNHIGNIRKPYIMYLQIMTRGLPWVNYGLSLLWVRLVHSLLGYDIGLNDNGESPHMVM